ncbi:hypothetical protein MPLA_630008 [Mesorhizobium sp. ORS 3359]|nr:hypothetical protein MPLA_630008 [Mesorhizobium sp. ORS 3359]
MPFVLKDAHGAASKARLLGLAAAIAPLTGGFRRLPGF